MIAFEQAIQLAILGLCDEAKLHNAPSDCIYRWGVPVKLPWECVLQITCPSIIFPAACVSLCFIAFLHPRPCISTVIFSDFPPSSFAIGYSTGQQEAGTTGLQAQFSDIFIVSSAFLEGMLAGYPWFPELHFASLCPSVQMWVLRLKFQWQKRHRLLAKDSCRTAPPNSAEHFSLRIVAWPKNPSNYSSRQIQRAFKLLQGLRNSKTGITCRAQCGTRCFLELERTS